MRDKLRQTFYPLNYGCAKQC